MQENVPPHKSKDYSVARPSKYVFNNTTICPPPYLIHSFGELWVSCINRIYSEKKQHNSERHLKAQLDVSNYNEQLNKLRAASEKKNGYTCH